MSAICGFACPTFSPSPENKKKYHNYALFSSIYTFVKFIVHPPMGAVVGAGQLAALGVMVMFDVYGENQNNLIFRICQVVSSVFANFICSSGVAIAFGLSYAITPLAFVVCIAIFGVLIEIIHATSATVMGRS